MISAKEKQLYQHISHLAGWDIAKYFNCGYSGDSDPIQHNGFFYDTRDWEAYGYASCVEFWLESDSTDETLHVQCGTINKPSSDADMESCFGSMGDDRFDSFRSTVEAQIETVRGYWGIEPDGTTYPQMKSFRLSHWQEWRIWRSVAEWLKALGD